MVSRKTPPSRDRLLERLGDESIAESELRISLQVAALKQRLARESARRKVAEDLARQASETLEASIEARKSYKPLAVKRREKTSRVHELTAMLLYSDIHPDEVVDPETVNGTNEYDPDIAMRRNQVLADAVKWNLEMLRDKHGPGYRIRDFVLGLLGDMISNTIHPELMEGNSMMPAEALLFAEQLCVVQIESLLSDPDLETIWVPCVHGNHDRMTMKVRHQTKAGNSLGWILYHHLASRYRDEPRIQFDIARGNMVYTEIYGRTARFTHGDDIRYNGGSGGVIIPARKQIDTWNASRHAFLTAFGHFHRYFNYTDIVCNGSMIGYTAYAQSLSGATRELACQAMISIDKDYGKSWAKPIVLQDKELW
jgi:hypothetical protein